MELLALQALLLAGEHLRGHQTVVGEMQEPKLVFFQLLDPALVALDVPSDCGGSLVGVALHIGPDRFADLLGHLDGAVVLGDGRLNLIDGIVAALAVAALAIALASDATEVLVDAAVALELAVEQPSAALGTVERAS